MIPSLELCALYGVVLLNRLECDPDAVDRPECGMIISVPYSDAMDPSSMDIECDPA